MTALNVVCPSPVSPRRHIVGAADCRLMAVTNDMSLVANNMSQVANNMSQVANNMSLVANNMSLVIAKASRTRRRSHSIVKQRRQRYTTKHRPKRL